MYSHAFFFFVAPEGVGGVPTVLGVKCKYFEALAGSKPSQGEAGGRPFYYRPAARPSSWSMTEVPPLCRNWSR